MSLVAAGAVAAGGAIGSLARYGVGLLARSWFPGWPWGTLFVNVLGSFLIGLLFVVLAARPAHDLARIGLLTGLLGGFTTFSAFSIESLELLRTAGTTPALLYVATTLIAGLAGCAAGLWMGRALLA